MIALARMKHAAWLIAGLALRCIAAEDLGSAPGVVVATSADPARAYIGSPAIAILPDGSYVAAHDYFGKNPALLDRMRLFRSTDRGASWAPLAELASQAWSTLFVHRGALYLLGPMHRETDLVIRRSSDGGRTWTEPHDAHSGVLFNGKFHGAPVPVVVANGKIWRAQEEIISDAGWPRYFGATVVSAPEGSDLLEAANWTRTNALPFAPEWLPGPAPGWLEGNVVVAPNGRVTEILRVNARLGPDEPFALGGGAAGIPRYEIAARAELSADGRQLSFDPAHGFFHLPGSQSKFTIRFDPRSKRYWSLVQKITLPHEERDWAVSPEHQRNVLALVSSADLVTWREDCRVFRWREGERLSNTDRVAVQYVDWQFDGDDLVAVARTSWNGQNYHNANLLTFHRVKNFRALTLADSAPNLVPRASTH